MADKKEPPALHPCQVNGEHDVENIEPMGTVDEGDRILRDEYGFKWRGTCIHCGESIVAKDKAEYD